MLRKQRKPCKGRTQVGALQDVQFDPCRVTLLIGLFPTFHVGLFMFDPYRVVVYLRNQLQIHRFISINYFFDRFGRVRE
jgi:hypothetical protein